MELIWHPIEDAEKMGVKDGRWLILTGGDAWFEKPFYKGRWQGQLGSAIGWKFENGAICFPTHFFILPERTDK
jgi:hypothetical protein